MDEWAGPLDLASNRAAIERVAVALGLANIIFLIRRSLLNYPFGIAMVTLYAWIFAQEKLYSDALLQGGVPQGYEVIASGAGSGKGRSSASMRARPSSRGGARRACQASSSASLTW